jgi:hypothetical protein
MILPGTTDWILSTDQYQEWALVDKNAALWLYGSMGTGKSSVTHTVIEDRKKLSADSGPKFALAYFYFDGATRMEGGRYEINSLNILACLVKQAVAKASSQKLPEALLELYNKKVHERSGLTESQCLELLLELCGRLSTITVVFDGLDECPLPVQRDLLTKLRNISNSSEATVKIFIASRKEGDIADMVEEWFTGYIDITQCTEQAINEMIRAEVCAASMNAALKSRYCDRKGNNQSQDVIKVLQTSAEGMFRWVQIALDYLHDSESYGEMAARLGELKRLPGLLDLYDAIYGKIVSGNTESGQRKARAIETTFNFLLHGRPLFRQIQEQHMSVIVEGCDFNEKGRLQEPFRTDVLAKFCPSFLVFEAGGEAPYQDGDPSLEKSGPGPVLRFPHFSVKEYLLARQPAKYSERAGKAYLAALYMEVFIHPDVSFQALRTGIMDYYSTRWADHVWLELESQNQFDLEQQEISASTLSRYQQARAKFLQPVGQCLGFLSWHSYISRTALWNGDGITGFAYSISQTPLFARILLEQDLTSASIPVEDLNSNTALPRSL